jgi:hypothetical protein
MITIAVVAAVVGLCSLFLGTGRALFGSAAVIIVILCVKYLP